MPTPKHPKDPQGEREPRRRDDDPEASIDESKVSKVARDEHDDEELAEELAEDDLEDLAEDDARGAEGPDA